MCIFEIFYKQPVSSTEDASVQQHSLEKEAPMQPGAHQETEIVCELQKTRRSLTLHPYLSENMDISNTLTCLDKDFSLICWDPERRIILNSPLNSSQHMFSIISKVNFKDSSSTNLWEEQPNNALNLCCSRHTELHFPHLNINCFFDSVNSPQAVAICFSSQIQE